MKAENEEYIDNIDFSYIMNILKNNQNKKIFCFGGGSAAEILMQRMKQKIHIVNFLDNNSNLHGKCINGIQIFSPKILCEEEKGNYIVLILSRHVYEISRQLDSYGLKKDDDYYDIYTHFLPYFMIKKYISLVEDFIKFIDRIPDNELNNRPILYNEVIGVVCICEMNSNLTSYSLALGLLLRYYGYKVSLIIDTLPAFNSYCFFRGTEKIVRKQIDKIVDKIQCKSNDIEVLYIEQEGKQKLDSDDFKAIKKNIPNVLRWFDAQRDGSFLNGREEREDIAENILTDTLMYIKSFFDKHSFQSISVYTGIHKHRGMYVYYGQKIGMRVSTYDVPSPGKMLYSSNGVAGHTDDVVRLITGDYFNPNEKKVLLQLAKENFKTRRNSTVYDDGYNYQVVGYSDEIEPYDVIIPLNIFWDAAALQRDRIFSNFIDWLYQTIEFLMENTTASVMIREHPGQNKEPQCIYADLEKELPIIKKYNKRIFLAVASEEINTYQYLEQCKLVLPFTSTVGLEAIMLGKNVITHTDVYYNDIDVVIKARNKKEYFDDILYYLVNTELSPNINVDNAYLAYYYQMNSVLECEYCNYYTKWMRKSLKDLSEIPNISHIVETVGGGIPIIYLLLKEKLNCINDEELERLNEI